ncbi:hypothetical protein J7I97_24955 [Streptomyces sp. ISL-87]|uniref:hypothetical protein n=1 Tax=Streptomyces sp. ISL-87 TaxID=2819188 RepID=UPI001BEBFF10|nr:hypothetical protein [Streptomyces sp. ISL-87]MBT2611418.1 hypothetical protein [Streptomyces sp. ISL-87]
MVSTPPQPAVRFHVSMTFTPGGPKVEGTWEAEASAVKRFRGFIGTHGSDDVTITLCAETDGIRRRLRTWTKDHGEVLHAGQ